MGTQYTLVAEHEEQTRRRVRRLGEVSAPPEWREVVARAEQIARRPYRRGLLAGAVAAAALLVAPALAFQDKVLNFFSRHAASEPVTTRFADLDRGAPARMAPGVIAGEARAVRDYRLADGSTTRLWVAPTHGGGFCHMFARALGGCRSKAENSASSDYIVGFGMTGPRGRVPFVIGGDVNGAAGVDELSVRFEDGKVAEIELTPVSEPINAAFYLYEVPATHWDPGHRPAELVARRSDGSVVARQPLPTRFDGARVDAERGAAAARDRHG